MKKRIKHIVAIIAFVSFIPVASASIASYKTFRHENVNLTLCYNHDYIELHQLLIYKGIADILDKYAGQKIKEGKLDAGRVVDIEIGGIEFGGIPSVNLSRSKSGYHALLHEFPDLKLLMQLIDYFASPDWESLVYMYENQYESARKLLDKRLAEHAPYPDMSLTEIPVTVHKDGDIVITYRKQKLELYIEGFLVHVFSPVKRVRNYYAVKRDDVELGSIYPVKFKDRYLVFYNKEIQVCEMSHTVTEHTRVHGDDALILERDTLTTMNIILNYRIPAKTRYEHWRNNYLTEVYDDWLNVYTYGRSYPVFSYCYSRNRMYGF